MGTYKLPMINLPSEQTSVPTSGSTSHSLLAYLSNHDQASVAENMQWIRDQKHMLVERVSHECGIDMDTAFRVVSDTDLIDHLRDIQGYENNQHGYAKFPDDNLAYRSPGRHHSASIVFPIETPYSLLVSHGKPNDPGHGRGRSTSGNGCSLPIPSVGRICKRTGCNKIVYKKPRGLREHMMLKHGFSEEDAIAATEREFGCGVTSHSLGPLGIVDVSQPPAHSQLNHGQQHLDFDAIGGQFEPGSLQVTYHTPANLHATHSQPSQQPWTASQAIIVPRSVEEAQDMLRNHVEGMSSYAEWAQMPETPTTEHTPHQMHWNNSSYDRQGQQTPAIDDLVFDLGPQSQGSTFSVETQESTSTDLLRSPTPFLYNVHAPPFSSYQTRR